MEGTILIAAGGTGGHLFPGISVAETLRERNPSLKIVFVGTRRGLETRLVRGYPLELLPILPLKGVGLVRGLAGVLSLPLSLFKSLVLLVRLRPAAVLGIGGYVGGPVVLVAALLGVRTVILEPNARPGFTNRVLKGFVSKAACAYPETLAFFGRKGRLTGNPVRKGFRPRATRASGPKTLLVFGGSQGSRVLNETVLLALPNLGTGIRIIHQTGEAMMEEVARGYAALGREAEIVSFLDDMEARFAEADLILCRSGATTCAELTAAGKAAVLVPFAKAADDHQKVNAQALERVGAAIVLEEASLSGKALAEAIEGLLSSPEKLSQMEHASARLGRPDAAQAVAALLVEER